MAKPNAMDSVRLEKQKYLEEQKADEARKLASSREKHNRLLFKVETYLINAQLSWMREFLDLATMSDDSFTFAVPGHDLIFLRSGCWYVSHKASTGIIGEKMFRGLGEALINAEETK